MILNVHKNKLQKGLDDNKMFNMTEEQIKRMAGEPDDKCDYNTPIREGETIEPCIRGANKILQDTEQREMVYRIYRGVRRKNESME